MSGFFMENSGGNFRLLVFFKRWVFSPKFSAIFGNIAMNAFVVKVRDGDTFESFDRFDELFTRRSLQLLLLPGCGEDGISLHRRQVW